MSKVAENAYSVNLWCSKPGENDDCVTGMDFATRAEAEACFRNPWDFFKPMNGYFYSDVRWIELDGPDVHDERPEGTGKPRASDDGEWRREMQMQAGMGYGVQGWNDYEGC